MKKLSTLFCLIIIIFSSFTELGCNSNCNTSSVLSITALHTVIRIETHDKALSHKTKKELRALFDLLEQEFDESNQNSLPNLIDNANINQSIRLTPTQAQVLSISKDLYDFTDEKFNPALLPLVELWKFKNYKVLNFTPPTAEQINDVLPQIDFNDIILSNECATKSSDVRLDFGGVLKGYAIDRALEILTDAGHQKGYISVGNSSLAILYCEYLTVTHPRATHDKSTILNINFTNKQNATISTSGDYEKFYEYEGQRYSHIIDGDTGYPAQTGVISATMVGGSGAFTDAVTTALCVAEHTPSDLENSELVLLMRKIINKYPTAELYVFYEKDERKNLLTNKLQGVDFTLLDDTYSIVKI